MGTIFLGRVITHMQNYRQRVLSEASPQVLRPKDTITADGLARLWAPGLGHPRA